MREPHIHVECVEPHVMQPAQETPFNLSAATVPAPAGLHNGEPFVSLQAPLQRHYLGRTGALRCGHQGDPQAHL